MSHKKRQELLNDANFYFQGLEARKDALWDKFMKTKSKRTETLMADLLTTLDYASDFIRDVIDTMACNHNGQFVTKEQWQRRVSFLNPNFEFVDMGKEEVVIRCKHCGAIFTRSKNALLVSLRNGASAYCKCCQRKNGEYKDKADYTTIMKPGGGLAYRSLDLKPGMKIQIKIDDTSKIAG